MHLHRLLLSCLCVGVLATPAAAQDPQVDPASPAGTEYQLPIDRARRQAAHGGPRDPSSATGEAPLFGAGVSGSTPRSEKQRRLGSSARASAPRTSEEPDFETSTPQQVRAQASEPAVGESGFLAVGTGAAGVLLLGGLAGLAWRRRTTRG